MIKIVAKPETNGCDGCMFNSDAHQDKCSLEGDAWELIRGEFGSCGGHSLIYVIEVSDD